MNKRFLPLVQNGTVIETSGLRRRIATVPHKASPVPVPDAAANNLAEAHALAAFLVQAANNHNELSGLVRELSRLLSVAMNAEGDVLGIEHNPATDAIGQAESLLSRLTV